MKTMVRARVTIRVNDETEALYGNVMLGAGENAGWIEVVTDDGNMLIPANSIVYIDQFGGKWVEKDES